MPSPSPSVPPTPCPFIDSLSPDPCFTANISVGDNNPTGSNPGLQLGNPEAGANSSPIVWDPNPSGGFDSGWVSVQLVGNAGGGPGGMSLTTIQPNGTQTTVNYSGTSYGAINQVQISAAASTGNMKISFRSVQTAYYQNGTLTDVVTLSDDCPPIADTTGPNAPATAQEASQLVPATAQNTKVVVTAMIRIQSPQGTTPSPNAMVALINVYADDCNSD